MYRDERIESQTASQRDYSNGLSRIGTVEGPTTRIPFFTHIANDLDSIQATSAELLSLARKVVDSLFGPKGEDRLTGAIKAPGGGSIADYQRDCTGSILRNLAELRDELNRLAREVQG